MHDATLIILPGWAGSHETWADFVALATPHFQDVVVIDLPCFGDEPCPSDVWGVEEYAEFVREKINVLRHSDRNADEVQHEVEESRHNQRDLSTSQSSARDDVILVGHSFGGSVAARLVADNPNIVDHLVLSGAAVYRPKNYLRRWFFWGLAKIGKPIVNIIPSKKVQTLAKRVLYRAANSPDFDATIGMRRKIFKKIIREDQGTYLSKIAIPTTVVHGTHDTYVPFRFGKRMVNAIPNATFVSIESGRHGLHLHKQEELLQALTDIV